MNPNQEQDNTNQQPPTLQHPVAPSYNNNPQGSVDQGAQPANQTQYQQPQPDTAQNQFPNGQQAVAPTEAYGYNNPIPDKPKHSFNPKRFMIILGSFVTICLISIILMLVNALLPSHEAKIDKPKDTNKVVVVETPLTADQVIKNVKSVFAGTEHAKSPISLPVKAPNREFFTVIPDMDKLISVAGETPPRDANKQLDMVVKKLDESKFVKSVVMDGADNTDYKANFTRKDVICQVDMTSPEDQMANKWLEVKCLNMSDYSQYADAESAFAGLYVPLTSSSEQYAFIGKPTVQPGSTADYKRGSIQVSSVINDQLTTTGRSALYIQTPDGLWRYFADQDNDVVLGCDKYTDKDVQYTYAGLPCKSIKQSDSGVVPMPRKR